MQGKKILFKDKYIEGARVGAGKMGVVYQAQKRTPGSRSSASSKQSQQPELYAAKHVSLTKIDMAVAQKQLQILQQLKHKYIVRYYEDFIEDDELIMVMDFCEGKDLYYHIEQMKAKGKYFNESLVSTWIFQLILVVQYIHSCNIIHRDIKPQNIFVDRDMNLKIGDFGVSKLLEGTENCKSYVGTPYYFPPELINNEKYSKKADIWSLGCVIYEICTLEKPFSAKKNGLAELWIAINKEQPKNIPSIYSPDLNKLIRKMLIKDPKKRPTSRQLLQDPILVQLMINYSSQVNLKQEYEKKPVEKPTLSDSFIEGQSNVVNQKMSKFQQEIKEKLDNLKNKKVKSTEIDKYYQDVQNKMRKLQDVVSSAFKELKYRSEAEESKANGMNQSKANVEHIQLRESNMKSKIGEGNQSMSESDVTIQSVNLQNSSKKDKQKEKNQKKLQQSILAFDQSSSIDSVNSIFVETQKNGKPINTGQSSKLSASIKSVKSNTFGAESQLDSTVRSQFMETIRKTDNIEQIRKSTLQHLDEVSQQIAKNPSLILNETYLTMTLSLTNNEAAQLMANQGIKKKKGQGSIGLGTSLSGSSSNTLNFEFSKKDYDQSLNLGISSRKTVSENIIEQSEPNQEYEADFQSYEEDTEMDIREKQKKSVKQLFSSTLKNFSMSKNQSNNSGHEPNRFNNSLSTIRQQSNDGGSIISVRQQIEYE